MIRHLTLAAAAISLALPLAAQDAQPEGAPSPNAIVEAAPAAEWLPIAANDLLVMTLVPDRDGKPREVVIQLMPEPFSQGWVENIRTLAREGWYDGISVNRVQDNYVVQWGDADGEDVSKAKLLPEGLRVMRDSDYAASGLLAVPDPRGRPRLNYDLGAMMMRNALIAANGGVVVPEDFEEALTAKESEVPQFPEPKVGDNYAGLASFVFGWPIGAETGANQNSFWPVHCYGMVGVGRGYSPDTGSGAELYTVIGHAPRHLDRNIALVGRVIEGIEHLSSLPRGTGDLGFYETAQERVPIQSVRMVTELADGARSTFEYLSTEGPTFARYAEARANRRDPFFITLAGGADICNIPVPVRRSVTE